MLIVDVATLNALQISSAFAQNKENKEKIK